MANKSNLGDEKKEVGYPTTTLSDAVEFATAVKELGGSRTPVKKSVLAKHFGLAESTPSFFGKISASKSFGITDGWGGYRLTEQGRKYFYPTNETDKDEAGRWFITRPSAFNLLIKRFDGEKLPNLQVLGNILHQESIVGETWKERVASIFVRSAQFLGIIDENGFLRYNASVHTYTPQSLAAADSSDSSTQLKSESDQRVARLPRRIEPPISGNTVWAYPFKGSYIRLETPEEISQELWEKLNAYVQILKPGDAK